MFEELQSYIKNIKKETTKIPEQRKEKLREIAGFIQGHQQSDQPAKLTFICTHNSRRSQLCQIWAETLAEHWGLGGIEIFSGGTEVTAFNPRAVQAIRRAGFQVEGSDSDNAHYKIYFDVEKAPLICFSKTFDDPHNPQEHYAAIMTCSDADQNCPFVPGAESRFSIPYVDPKKSDGTPRETAIYDKRCWQIATEMYYLLSLK